MFTGIIGNGLLDSTPAPVPDFVVTGTLTPDATGNYFDSGATNDGVPVYEDESGTYALWRLTGSAWFITPVAEVGSPIDVYWVNVAGPAGTYSANPPFTDGTATATAGE